jgi:hypothetical protein
VKVHGDLPGDVSHEPLAQPLSNQSPQLLCILLGYLERELRLTVGHELCQAGKVRRPVAWQASRGRRLTRLLLDRPGCPIRFSHGKMLSGHANFSVGNSGCQMGSNELLAN